VQMMVPSLLQRSLILRTAAGRRLSARTLPGGVCLHPFITRWPLRPALGVRALEAPGHGAIKLGNASLAIDTGVWPAACSRRKL